MQWAAIDKNTYVTLAEQPAYNRNHLLHLCFTLLPVAKIVVYARTDHEIPFLFVAQHLAVPY